MRDPDRPVNAAWSPRLSSHLLFFVSHLLVFVVTAACAALCASNAANATLWITGDNGGTILEYAQRFQKARNSGERVIIDGKCLSACTMVIGMVPRDHVCVTPNAVLGFHAAFRRTETGAIVASTDATKFMMDAYPPVVRKWIKQRGGLTNQMIFLAGSELMAFMPSCPTASPSNKLSGVSPFRWFSQ
jgi:hypothetical protein